MSWARIDDAFDDHPKVLALLEHEEGGAAVGLWTLCLTWAHRNTRRAGKVPGLIPTSLPRRYLGPGARQLAGLLVKEGLWEERTEDDGWLIHDFDRYLPTAETREARSKAGKRGAKKRWGGKRADGGEPEDDGNLPESDSNLPSGSHDVDSKPMASDGSRAPAHRVIPNGITPTPAPKPVQPSAAADEPQPPGAELTITQRSKRITDAYAEAQPMCRWPAINTVVIRAIKTEKYTDGEIRDALLRLAAEGRSVTIEELRIEIEGLPPPRQRAAQNGRGPRPSTTDQRVAQAQALKAELKGPPA